VTDPECLSQALDVVEDFVRRDCADSSPDGEPDVYDSCASSTYLAAFELLVACGRAEWVGEPVGRRAFIRLGS